MRSKSSDATLFVSTRDVFDIVSPSLRE